MYLLHQAFTVPLNRFPPDESILICFGLNLCPVNVFHIQADEAFGREKEKQVAQRNAYISSLSTGSKELENENKKIQAAKDSYDKKLAELAKNDPVCQASTRMEDGTMAILIFRSTSAH